MVLCFPITKILFQRGAFTAYSTQITSQALLFYSIGLVACGGTKILVNAFYAMQDTVTPLRTAAASLAANIVFSLLFMWPLKVGGLALATSLASIFNYVFLYYYLRKKIGPLGISRIGESLFKILIAGAAMGCVCYLVSLRMNVVSGICSGAGSYFLVCFLLGSPELKELLGWISKRK